MKPGMLPTTTDLDDLSHLIASKLFQSEIGDKIKNCEITTEGRREQHRVRCILTENAL
jgi:hypothetical protein